MTSATYDVVVIGAGVFGVWTAYHLQRAGLRVVLLDGYGPGNSRASSGGESRIIRLGYGGDEIYTRSAQRSLKLWQEVFRERQPSEQGEASSFARLLHQTGVLWLARDSDAYTEATLATLRRTGVPFERLDRRELQSRYPQLALGSIVWGLLESESGVLMARRAVHEVFEQVRSLGADYRQDMALAPSAEQRDLKSIKTVGNRTIHGRSFVFACGAWLPKLFPSVLAKLIHVTRQAVFFFGATANAATSNTANLPVWIDFHDLVYAIPNVDGRGYKIAIDAHGPDFDPDFGERLVTEAEAETVRNLLSARLPALKDSPVIETRVCQYENTSNGDFLIDLHPDFDNVWLVGGGSGHGFKHGPVVGEYVAKMILVRGTVEPRFTLANKTDVRERKVY